MQKHLHWHARCLKGSPAQFQLTLIKAHMIRCSVLPVPAAPPASTPTTTTAKVSALIKTSAAASEACLWLLSGSLTPAKPLTLSAEGLATTRPTHHHLHELTRVHGAWVNSLGHHSREHLLHFRFTWHARHCWHSTVCSTSWASRRNRETRYWWHTTAWNAFDKCLQRFRLILDLCDFFWHLLLLQTI